MISFIDKIFGNWQMTSNVSYINISCIKLELHVFYHPGMRVVIRMNRSDEFGSIIVTEFSQYKIVSADGPVAFNIFSCFIVRNFYVVSSWFQKQHAEKAGSMNGLIREWKTYRIKQFMIAGSRRKNNAQQHFDPFMMRFQCRKIVNSTLKFSMLIRIFQDP